MPYETLRSLDLNLLVTLDVLLRECNVTRSAEQLAITSATNCCTAPASSTS